MYNNVQRFLQHDIQRHLQQQEYKISQKPVKILALTDFRQNIDFVIEVVLE
jgi:hypothetical protein